MSEEAVATDAPAAQAPPVGARGPARLGYVLLLLAPVGAVPAVVLAYLARRRAPDWLRTHYSYQISTFWYLVVLAILLASLVPSVMVVLFGAVLTLFWLVARCWRGLTFLARRQPHPDPGNFLID